MADSTTEIDLDSVIDRLLEGQFYSSPPFLSFFFLQAPGDINKVDGCGLCTALPRFVVRLVRVVAPPPGSVNLSAQTRIHYGVEGNQQKRLFTRKPFALIIRGWSRRSYIDFSTLPSRHLPVTHQMLIVFSLFNSAR